MNVIVLVKYIPNPEGTPKLGEDFRLVREGVEGGLDPGDEHGVEAALQLAEKTGGEVTVVTMGPEPAIAAVRRALSMGALKLERQTEMGYDVVQSSLPALVTLTAGANEPRYPTLKGIMQAKQKPMETLSVTDLGLSPEEVAASQSVQGIEPVPAKEAGEIVEDAGEAPAKVVEFLSKAK